MKPKATLAIVTDASDGYWRQHYFTQHLIRRWEAFGLRSIVVTDADPFVRADLALSHVDLSVVPEACRRLAERYPRVLNGGAVDIRKRRFSRLLVDRDEPVSGPVLVKTDLNDGGWRELRRGMVRSPLGPLLRRLKRGEQVGRLLARLEALRSWRRKRFLPHGVYPVYARRELVPAGVWSNPNLIVERLVAEREGDNYCCRHWLFFGPREVARRTVSPHPVIKFGAKLERLTDPVPEELRALREQHGFDYGKFDYGLVDGKVYLYDMNRTPSGSADPRPHAETIDVLCEGIRAFLPELD